MSCICKKKFKFLGITKNNKLEEAEEFFQYKTFVLNVKHIFELIILFIRIFKFNYHTVLAHYILNNSFKRYEEYIYRETDVSGIWRHLLKLVELHIIKLASVDNIVLYQQIILHYIQQLCVFNLFIWLYFWIYYIQL